MTRRFVVHGRVQGVGFRAFTQDNAEGFGLTGEVWNRRDGNVEAIARHEDPGVLDAFAVKLRHGPGYVQRVEIFDAEDRNDVDFRIGPTR